ncbi:INCE protein, partial [Leiothrix lutea]|nr:INCE protein [Leiothrix lutea]
IKDFIKRNTPTRLHLKCEFFSLQEKERQRLENLRKKQEAEEQRKKKVEEEKRRRQAEMKQKREERLRKALQARERAEQMEEKKKKRVEQKILQSDEKVHSSQVREEKVAEERSKRKGSKKHGEAEARKQKGLRWPYRVFFLFLQEENEQQEPLQKREDEVKERGMTVLELRNLLEQQQLRQAKERCELEQEAVRGDAKQRGKEKPPQTQQEPAAVAGKATKVGREGKCGLQGARLDLSRDRTGRGEKTPSTSSPRGTADQSRQGFEHFGGSGGHPGHGSAASFAHQCSLWFQKSLSTSCLGSLKCAQGPESPPANENSYGLDLNSDDSTDDESNPRKPVPAWADGAQLQQAIVHQYYHPVDVDALFGAIPSPRLEHIFYKSKPRYFKRTSSAVWHSPP